MRASACLAFGLVLFGFPAAALAQGIGVSADAEADADADADVSTSPTDAVDDEPVDHAPDDMDEGGGDGFDEGGDGGGDGGDGDGDDDDGGDLRDGDLPYAHVDRPMTLPEFYLAPSLGFANLHLESGGFSANSVIIAAGARFGITDDFEVEATPLSLRFGDIGNDGYSHFMAGATYRILKGDVEVGGRLRFALNTSPDVFINPSLPIRIHAGEIVRLDTGVNFSLVLPDGGDATPALAGIGGIASTSGGFFFAGIEPGVPLNVDFQIVEPFWMGLGTGFGMFDMTEGESVFVPLGLRAGGTIPGGKGEPLVDIDGGFSFPLFFTNAPRVDNPATEVWQFGVTGTVFLPL